MFLKELVPAHVFSDWGIKKNPGHTEQSFKMGMEDGEKEPKTWVDY